MSVKKYSFERHLKAKPVESTIRHLSMVRWKYRNSIYLVTGLMIAYLIISTDRFDAVVAGLRNMQYFGILLSGLFYAFSLTAVPATAIFYKLGSSFNPLLIACIGAFGTMTGDYLIFRFVKDNLMEELRTLTAEVSSKVFFHNSIFYRIFPFSNLLLSKKFRLAMFKIARSKTWRTAVIVLAGAVIMLPIPDEIGVAMMGAVNFRTKYFLLMSYCLNFAGIFMIVYMGGL